MRVGAFELLAADVPDVGRHRAKVLLAWLGLEDEDIQVSVPRCGCAALIRQRSATRDF